MVRNGAVPLEVGRCALGLSALPARAAREVMCFACASFAVDYCIRNTWSCADGLAARRVGSSTTMRVGALVVVSAAALCVRAAHATLLDPCAAQPSAVAAGDGFVLGLALGGAGGEFWEVRITCGTPLERSRRRRPRARRGGR